MPIKFLDKKDVDRGKVLAVDVDDCETKNGLWHAMRDRGKVSAVDDFLAALVR